MNRHVGFGILICSLAAPAACSRNVSGNGDAAADGAGKTEVVEVAGQEALDVIADRAGPEVKTIEEVWADGPEDMGRGGEIEDLEAGTEATPEAAPEAEAEAGLLPDLLPDIPPTIGEMCFPAVYSPGEPGPKYEQYDPVIASHCFGTDYQTIIGVEKVVFLGDSVTVGTPNMEHLLSVDNNHFYRNLTAEWLAGHFNLDTGDFINWGMWKTYDYFSGKGGKLESGDFKNCAKWGARTDDLLEGGGQIPECFPEGGSPERTLFLLTMGGNDIAKITQTGAEADAAEVAAGYPKAWALAESTAKYLEDAVKYIKDPTHFPSGAFIIYVNGFEFTDGTGKTSSCTPQTKLNVPGIGEIDLADLGIPVALLAGYGEWEKPEALQQIVIYMLEQYMRIAVENQVDMIWTVESFCGHGYVAAGANADPETMCYLGPDAALYFDETCIHPSPAGHKALFEMFKAVVLE